MVESLARAWAQFTVVELAVVAAGLLVLGPLAVWLHGRKAWHRHLTEERLYAAGIGLLIVVWLGFFAYNRYVRG